MRIKYIITGVALCAIIISCKKEKQESIVPPEECTVNNGASSGQSIPGSYIVAYDPSYQGREMAGLDIESKSELVLTRNDIPASRIIKTFDGGAGGFVAHLQETELDHLKNDATISAIEPDRIIALSTCFTVAEPRLLTWNINKVGYGNGIGKTAWIIDSGIDFDHPDLTVDEGRSKSFINGVISADDENGHGTHVAGIIGAKNNSIGVLGVASGATLVSLRVLDAEGKGTLSSILQALSYINNNARAGDVVNISLGEDGNSSILVQQVQHTASLGIFISIAAGNDSDAANKYSPANANGINIYTISAIDSLDRFASFSNYGNDVVDYAAPGVRILSTFSAGRYAYLSGTSMAAPHVAGLLLLRGRNISTSGYVLNDPDSQPDPIAHY
jgi:subtilisin family serine protease